MTPADRMVPWLGPVIDFSDSMIFAMSLANIRGMYFLAKVINREITQYREKVRTGDFPRVDQDATH